MRGHCRHSGEAADAMNFKQNDEYQELFRKFVQFLEKDDHGKKLGHKFGKHGHHGMFRRFGRHSHEKHHGRHAHHHHRGHHNPHGPSHHHHNIEKFIIPYIFDLTQDNVSEQENEIGRNPSPPNDGSEEITTEQERRGNKKCKCDCYERSSRGIFQKNKERIESSTQTEEKQDNLNTMVENIDIQSSSVEID